jgi:hypothetical protein
MPTIALSGRRRRRARSAGFGTVDVGSRDRAVVMLMLV